MIAALNRIKKILVATDFSETSNFAIKRAIEIAQINNASLTICHVAQEKLIEKFFESIAPKGLLQTSEEYALASLHKKIKSLARHKLNIKHIVFSNGKPASKIVNYAKRNRFDLIIIGAHGKHSIRDSFIGTTADHIAKKTPCPILIVKKHSRQQYKKILIPVDFSSASKQAANFASSLFSNYNLRLIHVGDYEYEEILEREESKWDISRSKITKIRKSILGYLKNQMKIFIHGCDKELAKVPSEIVLGYPGATIVKKATKSKYDLIVMGTQGHGRMHYLSVGSVASWVLTEVTTDIMLVPPKLKI